MAKPRQNALQNAPDQLACVPLGSHEQQNIHDKEFRACVHLW